MLVRTPLFGQPWLMTDWLEFGAARKARRLDCSCAYSVSWLRLRHVVVGKHDG